MTTSDISKPQPFSLRVLVVDDNEASAKSVAWMIESLGDETCTCLNGACAIKAAADFNPDVVLLDIVMPEMDGLQVCDRLRADPRFAGLKIIAQTGWGDKEMRRQTTQHGFDLHLVKPVDPELLEDMLGLLRKGRTISH